MTDGRKMIIGSGAAGRTAEMLAETGRGKGVILQVHNTGPQKPEYAPELLKYIESIPDFDFAPLKVTMLKLKAPFRRVLDRSIENLTHEFGLILQGKSTLSRQDRDLVQIRFKYEFKKGFIK